MSPLSVDSGLISNGDFDQYWAWHLTQEQQRIHNSRYLNSVIPTQ